MKFIEYLQSTHQLGAEQGHHMHMDWIFWGFMFFNLVAFAFVRTAHPGYISVLFRTGVYNRQLYQNTQEDLRLNSAGSMLLTIAYFNCVAVLLVSLIPNPAKWLIWSVLLVAMAVTLTKFILIRFLGFLTETREGLTEHWINHLVYFQMIPLIVTPILCLTHFWPQTVQYEISLMLALLICGVIFLRDFQSFIRALRQRVSIVYIILYLCTLELIPLIVLIRVLVR